MFPPSNLPLRGQSLLLTDQLASPSTFLLYKSIADHLKKSPQSKSLFLSISESFSRLKIITGKSNINISQHLTLGNFVFLDVAERFTSINDDEKYASSGRDSLRSLLEHIRKVLDEWTLQGAKIQLTLDDISTLEWIGLSSSELIRFVRALSSLSRKSNASLIIRHHVLTPEEPDDLTRLLLQLCAYHLDVFPLSTGKSGSVSGQVALHLGPSAIDHSIKPIPRSSAVQYKLTDTGCVFFDRGTGSSVL